MEFVDVTWLHEDQDFPVRLVSELNAERYETRKLEFFRNGVVGVATSTQSTGGTSLGTLPVPPLSEINSSPEFVGTPMSLEVGGALAAAKSYQLAN